MFYIAQQLPPYSNYGSTVRKSAQQSASQLSIVPYSTLPCRSIAPSVRDLFLMRIFFSFFLFFFFFSSQQFWVIKQWVSSYWNGIVVTMYDR